MNNKYTHIADQLRANITSGHYPAGSTLPAIPEIMEQHGVARGTVLHALTHLTQEGLVIPRRGIGTVVRDTNPVNLRGDGLARTWNEHTSGTGVDEVVETGWEPADPDIAARLAIEPGTRVLRRVRHFHHGQTITQIAEQWIPEHVVNAIAASGGGDLTDLTDQANHPDVGLNLFQLMGNAGYAPDRDVKETVSTRMPRPHETEVMELPTVTAVLVTDRVVFGEDGTPVETLTAVGAGDRMSATFTVTIEY